MGETRVSRSWGGYDCWAKSEADRLRMPAVINTAIFLGLIESSSLIHGNKKCGKPTEPGSFPRCSNPAVLLFRGCTGSRRGGRSVRGRIGGGLLFFMLFVVLHDPRALCSIIGRGGCGCIGGAVQTGPA